MKFLVKFFINEIFVKKFWKLILNFEELRNNFSLNTLLITKYTNSRLIILRKFQKKFFILDQFQNKQNFSYLINLLFEINSFYSRKKPNTAILMFIRQTTEKASFICVFTYHIKKNQHLFNFLTFKFIYGKKSIKNKY